ncbi:MAG: hypothetical protein LBI18_10955, partial [Planctomycetaceae bacterium]|nr:hypothetical protein [Planctomycetaceae bacterium]
DRNAKTWQSEKRDNAFRFGGESSEILKLLSSPIFIFQNYFPRLFAYNSLPKPETSGKLS